MDGVWERAYAEADKEGMGGAGVCERDGYTDDDEVEGDMDPGPGVCDRGGIDVDADDEPGPGVCDRGGTFAGVCDLGAGVCERTGLAGTEGVVGREDIEADLECMELNRDKGDAAAAAAEAELLGE
jgi:hypothetical protein